MSIKQKPISKRGKLCRAITSDIKETKKWKLANRYSDWKYKHLQSLSPSANPFGFTGKLLGL